MRLTLVSAVHTDQLGRIHLGWAFWVKAIIHLDHTCYDHAVAVSLQRYGTRDAGLARAVKLTSRQVGRSG